MTMSTNRLVTVAGATCSHSGMSTFFYTPLQNSRHSFSRQTRLHIVGLFIFCSFSTFYNAPQTGKASKGSGAAKAVTPKNRPKQPVHKSTPPPVYSPAIGEDSSDLDRTLSNQAETESGLKGDMDMLMDTSSRPLQTTVQSMVDARVDKAAEATQREEYS